MITVVIPALNAEATLPATLTALVPAALEGLVREVIVVDGGSTDRTREIADQAGAEVLAAPPNRGAQMRAGANAARHPWLLFINADTVLDAGWEREADHFMERVDSGASRHAAAAFRFALDDDGIAPRALEGLVRLRCATLRLPYGDQGLLIGRASYDKAGGHRPVPLMEDVRPCAPRRDAPHEDAARPRRQQCHTLPPGRLPAPCARQPGAAHPPHPASFAGAKRATSTRRPLNRRMPLAPS